MVLCTSKSVDMKIRANLPKMPERDRREGGFPRKQKEGVLLSHDDAAGYACQAEVRKRYVPAIMNGAGGKHEEDPRTGRRSEGRRARGLALRYNYSSRGFR